MHSLGKLVVTAAILAAMTGAVFGGDLIDIAGGTTLNSDNTGTNRVNAPGNATIEADGTGMASYVVIGGGTLQVGGTTGSGQSYDVTLDGFNGVNRQAVLDVNTGGTLDNRGKSP